jgi:phosphate-selective porin OprO/OprP
MPFDKHIGASIAFAIAIGAPAFAHAQSVRIDELQRQIRQLQEQLSALQRQVEESQVEIRKAQEEARAAKPPVAPPPSAAAPTPAPHATMSRSNRPGIESADRRNSVELVSRLQLDAANYLRVKPQGRGSPSSLTSGVNARRARIGFLGTFQEDWHYALIYDFGGSSDSLTASGALASGIENAYISYTGFRPLAIEGGYMDVPWTLEEAMSSIDLLFLERASPQVVATGLVAGDFRSAFGVRWVDPRLWVGTYVTGPIAGSAHTGSNQQQLGAVGRVAYQFAQTPEYSVHLGVNVGHVFQPRTSTAPVVKQLTLSDRPELRVDPTSILSTGPIAAKNASIYGLEAAASYRSLFFQGEFFHYVVDQYPSLALNGGHTPTLEFNGGYAEASWTLTGESHRYNPESGAYLGIVPDHPFSLGGGSGAWEIAARFSQIDLNDHVVPGLLQTATGGAYGGLQRVYSLGLNWYPNVNVRFMFDYIHATIDKLAGTTAGTPPVGARIDALAARGQVAF